MEPWRAWRKAERERLLAGRAALSSAEREAATAAIASALEGVLPEGPGRVLGLYWPIKGELDLRAWALGTAERRGWSLALPVVVEPRTPLVYRPWSRGTPMERGFWNILVPAGSETAVPDVVIAPLVGFRADGLWRLGYGGGYFDRTLASLSPRPLAIGIGLAATEVPGYAPEPHDIPMDAIVTEAGVLRR
ncbi:5-formyltetrahydrofolate cyclo-ligase [Prosthecomicrobium sp. N25]|uniref:5-formyltetrahydrofolate cyclo-ligase n=1 Tax=Prosthecomicrobium sp. N25 TaxID=3129254 RepID=UPI003078769C